MIELNSKEARQKLCPFNTNTYNCVADDCMAWEWTDFVTSYENREVKFPTDENGNNRKIENFVVQKPHKGICKLIVKG